MKNQLVDIFLKESGAFKPFIVGIDNKEEINKIYKKLNEVTSNNWTYNIDEVRIEERGYYCTISLFVPGRVMPGCGSSTSRPEEALENAIRQSVSMLYPHSLEESIVSDVEKESKENEEEQPLINKELEDIRSLDDALTFDEIDAQELNEETEDSKPDIDSDDNELAMDGNTITKGQVKFINDFKETNQIDSDEKFNYYIKTWATNNAIDGIDNKLELIQSGYDILESFIKWIKIMQPALEKGIVSPI